MNDPHEAILERYFWDEVDRGIAPAATPLFTGIHEGEPLANAIRRECEMSEPAADAAIELARMEVEL